MAGERRRGGCKGGCREEEDQEEEERREFEARDVGGEGDEKAQSLKRNGSANASSSEVSFEKPERVQWRLAREGERKKELALVSWL